MLNLFQTNHVQIVKDTVILSTDQKSAKIEWTYNSGFWSTGTKFIITRMNITSGNSQNIEITKEADFKKGYFTDNMIQLCNEYRYSLQLVIPNSAYETLDPDTTIGITPLLIGDLKSLTASKGYYSNRIELNWESIGAFDEFSIQRKEFSQSDDNYKQIFLVPGSATNTIFNAEDLNAVPGVVYSYRVVGLVSCSSKTEQSVTKPTDIGFRTPTGDFYGRVTFSDGQAVEGVSINLSSETNIFGKSYKLNGSSNLKINNAKLLSNANDTSITIQAWVKRDPAFDNSKESYILRKEGMYELYVKNNNINFRLGNQNVVSSTSMLDLDQLKMYVHVSAVVQKKSNKYSVYLYLNGTPAGSAENLTAVTPAEKPIILGESIKGYFDEVRIWDRALSEEEIKQDYNRILSGGEKGLKAYYTFNYAVNESFYDMSYIDNDFNKNHGTAVGAELESNNVPSVSQLSYKGITNSDGSYTIRSVPYMGNGTAYTLVPTMGIHSFEPSKDIRFLGPGAQSHTVNFTDKSSFTVSGTVTYEGGTIPVEGVMFQVDGKTAIKNNGTIIQTNDSGRFVISVPVGVHEVKAVKNNHVFADGGRLLRNGQDRNYQDDLTGYTLTDLTKVKYIGRVAGGVIQEAFPLGHSLSKNNLADSIKVILKNQKKQYKLYSGSKAKPNDSTAVEEHFNSKFNNQVVFAEQSITIKPNGTTGEFVAYVIPEKFDFEVQVPGHILPEGENFSGIIDFSNSFLKEKSIRTYDINVDTDSVKTKQDTVYFNKKNNFILRYDPKMSVKQLVDGSPVDYFGSGSIMINTLDASNSYTLQLYNNGKYLIGSPVFEQGLRNTFKIKVFEEYIYKTAGGTTKAGIEADLVPTKDARIIFDKGLMAGDPVELTVDSLGEKEYMFTVADPDKTMPKKSLSAKYYWGSNVDPKPFKGDDFIILGSIVQGRNFVTAGPDELMFILRDPPGSNSYSYLEKGTTFNSTTKYVGNVSSTTNVGMTTLLGAKTVTFVGVGAGIITEGDIRNEISVSGSLEGEGGGTKGSSITKTTLTRFETSSDPAFVGADGDLFVGLSTNLTFGATDNVNIISWERYNANRINYEVYKEITPVVENNFLLVKETGIGIAQNYKTLFAYPQIHIETVLIPNLQMLKRSFLHPKEEQISNPQKMAEDTGAPVYISNLYSTDINYGKSNSDTIFKVTRTDDYNGESYKIYFPASFTELQKGDTIEYINQALSNWHKHLKRNEEIKVTASEDNKQNYSFHAGSPITYAETLSGSFEETQNFSITIGGKLAFALGAQIMGNGLIVNIEEEIKTKHGGEWSQSNNSTVAKGFSLKDTGSVDYLSVDVLREDSQSATSGYIFKTKAGVTSCPYEGQRLTKYYQPGTEIDVATVRVESPKISTENKFVQNVPSGQPAYIKLNLRNGSDAKIDNIFDLKIVDSANPYGAKFIMDGAPIGNGRAIAVPVGQSVEKTLEVSKGSVMNYNNLKLVLQSQCQPEICDTLTLTVHFTPSCTNVNIAKPNNNWIYNTNLPTTTVDGITKRYMEVVLDGFDVNYDNFDHIELQYKTASDGESGWVPLMSYYNNEALYLTAKEEKPAEMINPDNAGTIKYNWSIDNLPDQRYDLRAISVCKIGTQSVINQSTVKSGIKDMYNPRMFGNPLPANGILTINDEVRLNFNEKIADGYLTYNNFAVTAIKNGSTLDGSTSVLLDGLNDAPKSEISRNWRNKNITVSMKIMRTGEPQDATYFSHGDSINSLEFGITKDGVLNIKVGSETLSSTESVVSEKDNWAFVAFSIDSLGKVSAYYNGTAFISDKSKNPYTGEGTYFIGKSISNGKKYFGGKIQNVKIWNKVIDLNTLQSEKDKYYSGLESHLMNYYPMNEARGTFLEDKASGAHLQMNGAIWSLPDGYAVKFNGTNQLLKVSTGSLVLEKAMDYTMEFWFKASPDQINSEVTMVSNGAGDGLDFGGSSNLFSIGFDKSILTFYNNGIKQTVEGKYQDNNWHHFALSVNRNSGRAQIYIDGKMKTFFDEANLGSIASANIYVGARGWVSQTSKPNIIFDNYFKGNIDEFRIWDLYKNELIVSQNNNKKLDGTEKGLRAYYPFEKYERISGIEELAFTTKDFKAIAQNAVPVPDAEKNGAIETMENSPVANKGPVSNLLYNFVVNDDALIISLKEQADKIEKSIVTFTVQDVRDINGNKLISPIIWSAYIDRNQLKWNTTEFNLEKQVYQPLEFSNQITNKGGAMAHYTLQGMPSWLTVTPSDGVINPASSAKITFTVDEGLNIGSHNEIIYMRNDDNVVEALPVNIRVLGENPNWTVDPGEFDENMSVFGKIRIKGQFSNDKEDVLAVFSQGKCVGVAKNTYDKANDFWYAFLTIYSKKDAPSTNLRFRIWDASAGKIYDAESSPKITYKNDAVFGSGKSPEIFDGQEKFFNTVPLKTGWNWISFNLANDSMKSVNYMLGEGKWKINDEIKKMAIFDRFTSDGTWIGTLSSNGGLNNTSMYMIRSSFDQNFGFNGKFIDPKTKRIKVKGNSWNFISYLPSVNQTVKDALSGYPALENDIIKSQNQFAMYSTGIGWVGNLVFMEPGKGYMLKRNGKTDSITFYYPSQAGTLSYMPMKKAKSVSENAFTNYQYPENMSIVAVANGMQHGDKILAFAENELVGVSQSTVYNENELQFISIAGGDESPVIRFALEREGRIIAQSTAKVPYFSNTVAGSLDKPLIIDFTKPENAVSVSPNPFKDRLLIDLSVEKSDEIKIAVFDVLGRMVHQSPNVTATNSYYQTELDGSSFREGVYLLRVTINDEITVVKVEKK